MKLPDISLIIFSLNNFLLDFLGKINYVRDIQHHIAKAFYAASYP